jgi:hypothetical protein
MADPNLQEFLQFVAANPQMPWADFSCTPVLDLDAGGKASTAVRRCAVTAGAVTVLVHLPHRLPIGKGESWPPKFIVDAMLEAVGPMVST